MTLRHIRIFVEIYRTCNITRTSAALHMTQPAVTRALQELEQTYHIRLFERMYHHLIPTEGARQLYPQALYLLAADPRDEPPAPPYSGLAQRKIYHSSDAAVF